VRRRLSTEGEGEEEEEDLVDVREVLMELPGEEEIGMRLKRERLRDGENLGGRGRRGGRGVSGGGERSAEYERGGRGGGEEEEGKGNGYLEEVREGVAELPMNGIAHDGLGISLNQLTQQTDRLAMTETTEDKITKRWKEGEGSEGQRRRKRKEMRRRRRKEEEEEERRRRGEGTC